MLTKCSNPSCCVTFRYLTGGRLFLLESDRALSTCNSDRPEYFWLCGDCSSFMTLRLGQGATVVAVPLPNPLRNVPSEVGLNFEERKAGLFLHSIGVSCLKPFPEDRGAQLRCERSVAARNKARKWREEAFLQNSTGSMVSTAT